VVYDGEKIDLGYRIDLIVESSVIVEIKCVEIDPVHHSQLLSYMRLSGRQVGLLINFHIAHLRDGVKRIVDGDDWSKAPTTEITEEIQCTLMLCAPCVLCGQLPPYSALLTRLFSCIAGNLPYLNDCELTSADFRNLMYRRARSAQPARSS
jgi:PD-(D/E)XK nuclease superfamily